MSVVPMKRIQVIALRRDRKAVLEYLQVLGAVEISIRRKEDDVFKKRDKSKEQQVFLKNADRAEEALAILKRNVPEKTGLLSSLEGRKELTKADFERLMDRRDEILDVCFDVISLDKQQADIISGIPKLMDQKKALEPWMQFDIPLSMKETEKTAVFIGTLPGASSRESFYTELKRLSGIETFDADIIYSDATQTCLFAVCEKKDAAAVQEALRKMGFAAPPVSDMNPAERVKEIDREIEESSKKLEDIQVRFEELAQSRDEIKFASDYFTLRAEKYSVLSELLQSKRVFYLAGYVPETRAQEVKEKLESRYDVDVTLKDPGKKDTPPVLLSNNAFAAPLEGVTESYSMPGKGEIDPTFIAACFYYILFGMMLSDAAYGLIIFAATAIILKKYGKTMESGMKKTMQMFFLCGIATTFWGFMFGSFFGDAVNVIATTFFHRPDVALKPLWFEPINEPMRMLTFCFLIALIHMFVGLGAKGYMYLKKGQVLDAVYDVLFWYLLLIGCVVYLLTVPTMTDMLGVNTLSTALQKPMMVLMIIGAAGIILTGGRESKNWGKRILKGLYSLYGISSWLSDVLSYSRLLALGLATGVIATVFNSMGSMGGDGPVGIVMFILVFLIGNVLNLAINALGAYVHTNRLTYVEFFGKFYDGGGRKFKPFTYDTKYYKFKEEI